MPRGKRTLASDLTLDQLKQLLAVKEKMVALEEKKARLESELAAVNAALRRIAAGAGVASPAEPAGRKIARKAKGRPARKKARKKARRAAPAAKKATRRAAAAGRRTPRRGRGGATVQEVVAGLIRKNGKPMAFQDILSAITKRKLVRTRSKDFSNVLRRTLSTSTAVKRVGRGLYAVAK